MTTILEVFVQKEAPVSNLAGKKMRSTRGESSSLLYRLGFCTYVGTSVCMWHMQNDLPRTVGPAMTAVTEYAPRLSISEEMLLYLFYMSGS